MGRPLDPDIAELWHEIIVDPDDDGPRAVLGDLLQAAGDPRGELISLQMLPAEDAAAPHRQARIQELLREHAGTWLGPLRDIIYGLRFDRGFLSALELDVKWPADHPRWERSLTNRTLMTVTELPQPVLSKHRERRGAVYARFMTSPVMAALRRVEVFDAESAAGLEACVAPLAHVSCRLYPGEYNDGDTIRDIVLPACGHRATITSFALSADMLPMLERQPWFERLTTITVGCAVRTGLALWPRVPAGTTFVILPSPEIEPCMVSFPWEFRIELAREAGALVARIAGEWTIQPLSTLGALPREVSRIEIEHTSELMARRVSEAVARRGVEIVVRAPRRAGNLRLA